MITDLRANNSLILIKGKKLEIVDEKDHLNFYQVLKMSSLTVDLTSRSSNLFVQIKHVNSENDDSWHWLCDLRAFVKLRRLVVCSLSVAAMSLCSVMFKFFPGL